MPEGKTKTPMPFERALARLEEIVAALETGDAGLEESIKLYEEGMKLKALCEDKLKEARLRVEKIVEGADGRVSKKPAPDILPDEES